MNDEEFGVFEKSALAFLRSLGLTPDGYYPYSHCSDVSGYLPPQPPFRVPVKMMVEIVRALPTRASVEGFHKLAKDSLVERTMLICQAPLTDLDGDLQSLIDRLGIEFFDQATITAELEKKNIGKSEIQESSKIYELVAPPALAEALPEIAQQRIPEGMTCHVEKLGLKPWQVFEQAVYSIFSGCFGYTVRKLGEDCLFQHEPEGVVTAGETQPFAMIYECKTAREAYLMTAQDELTYKDYILRKRDPIQVMSKCALKYFIIVAPGFSGDVAERRDRIFQDTQVLTVFMRASLLASIAKWAWNLSNDAKRLIDLRRIFKLGEVVVSDSTFLRYTEEFEQERSRW